MYKSFKIMEYRPMSLAPKPFGTEPEKQDTQSKYYKSIRRLIKSMKKNIKKKLIIYKYYIYCGNCHKFIIILLN